MIVRQFLHTEPVVAASYFIACGGKQLAAVVDPVSDPETYLSVAREHNTRIRYVVDTHLHADHLSTGRALAGLADAAYVLHAEAETSFAFHGVRDGERLELGNVAVDVWHVPGHTPEHIALLVTDRTRAPEPWLVLTGHTLMIGDMGRTELATSGVDGARALFESARRLKTLADYVQVLPGAFSGSVCGRGLSATAVSTIGFERRFNRVFALDDVDTFIDVMRRDIPPRPPDAEQVRAANRGLADATAARPSVVAAT